MEAYILEYLKKYKGNIIENLSNTLVMKVTDEKGKTRYVQLWNFRILNDRHVIFSFVDADTAKINKRNDLIIKTRNLIIGKRIREITINSTRDLIIRIENSIMIECLVLSNYYENWVINDELISLPGGDFEAFF